MLMTSRPYDVFPRSQPADIGELGMSLGFLFAHPGDEGATSSAWQSQIVRARRAPAAWARRMRRLSRDKARQLLRVGARQRGRSGNTAADALRVFDSSLATARRTLSFHFTDCEGLDHRLDVGGNEVSVTPAFKPNDAATIHTTWAAYAAFFLNQKSAQLLFYDGDWSFWHGRSGYFDFAEVAASLMTLEGRLPSPCMDPAPFRGLVREASVRLRATRIDRIGVPSASEFVSRYARSGEPIVVAASTASWPKSVWRFEDLIEAYGDRQTHLSEYPPLVFPIREFLERVSRGDPVGVKAALPLIKPIRARYAPPPQVASDTLFTKAQAVIVAPADTAEPAGYAATCWHRDWADNFLVQLIGRKKVYLAPPADEDCFYCERAPARSGNVATDFSPVTPKAPDLERYPAFRRARIMDCILEPGDTLYLPCGWFHHVENLSPSCAINCWRIHPLSGVVEGLTGYDQRLRARTTAESEPLEDVRIAAHFS